MLDSCKVFNTELLLTWTGRSASPFPGQLPISNPAEAKMAVRKSIDGCIHIARDFFGEYPLLGIWSTLTPLAEEYGASDTNIYSRIGKCLGLSLDHQDNRERFKTLYRCACRDIGVLVTGNTPSDLFFPPLGVADSKIDEWSSALAHALAVHGPPATEDTPSALSWQRSAKAWLPEGLSRPQAAIDFDRAAYYADRVNAWRRDAQPLGSRDAHLFAALDRAIWRQGLRKDRILGPPRLVWHRDGLALLAEPAKMTQLIKVGPFPDRLDHKQAFPLPVPWPDEVTWTATKSESVPCAPQSGRLVLFDADTGEKIDDLDITSSKEIETRALHVIALSLEPFEASGFGPAALAADPRFQIAGITRGSEIKAGAAHFWILPSHEPSISIRTDVLGRAGVHALRSGAADSQVDIQLNPDLLGPRILRVTRNGQTLHRGIQPDEAGCACLRFSDLALDKSGDPGPVRFEILVPGASECADARAELKVSEHIWPGVTRNAHGNIENALVPSLFNPAKSTGFYVNGNQLTMDPSSDANEALLCLSRGECDFVYHIPFRGIRVWRHRVSTGEKERVPMNAQLRFGPEDQQDSLTVEAPECVDNLIVRGDLRKKPFLARSQLEIPASALMRDSDDDRIAFIDLNGRAQLLARVLHVAAARCVLDETDTYTHLRIKSTSDIDAVGIRIAGICGDVVQGAVPLANRPVDAPLPAEVRVAPPQDGWVEIQLPKSWCQPALAFVELRETGETHFTTCLGQDGYPVVAGLTGPHPRRADLFALSAMLSGPAAEEMQDHPQRLLGPVLQELMRSVAKPGLVTPILPAWKVERNDGGVPRGDLLSVAPWTFQAPLYAFASFRGHSLLDSLAHMSAVPMVSDLPNPYSDDPLGAWLDRVASGSDLPPALDAESLDRAFVTLDARLRGQGLRHQLSKGPLGGALRLTTEAYSAHVDQLRSFDRVSGHREDTARIMALLERFARASRTFSAEAFLAATVQRTGLSAEEVGEVLTILIRAAAIGFAHFLTVWAQAVDQHIPSEQEQQAEGA